MNETFIWQTFCTGMLNSPFEILAFGVHLGFVVEGSKFGHQVGGVLCCVHSQRLGDDEKSVRKLCNGQLLSGTLRGKTRKTLAGTSMRKAQQVEAFLCLTMLVA